MSVTPDDYGAKLGKWQKLVRRSRIDPELKLAALTLASYANASGREIAVSVARLAVDVDINYSAARRHLAELRRLGLIELTKRANRRLGRSDVYRLTIGPDTDDLLDLPSEDAYRKLISEITNTQRNGNAERARRYRQRQREARNNAQAERGESVSDPVDNPNDDGDGPPRLTLITGGAEALFDGITLKTSRNNAQPQPPDLRRRTAYLPTRTSPLRTTSPSNPAGVAQIQNVGVVDAGARDDWDWSSRS